MPYKQLFLASKAAGMEEDGNKVGHNLYDEIALEASSDVVL